MISNLNVLLVEDDDVVAESIRRSLKKVAPDIKLIDAENGQIALDILHNRHPSKILPTPYLVLSDLNMPVMNGFEFLDAIRNDAHFKDIVVFILTTSDDDNDRSRAYHHHVAGYMLKASVGPQFAKLASLMNAYKNAVELTN